MDKVLLLDIDKTIIDTDSMMLFVLYSMRYDKTNILRLPLVIIATILYQLHLMPVEHTKSIVYKPINKMSKEDIDYFMDNIVMKHKNQEPLRYHRQVPGAGLQGNHGHRLNRDLYGLLQGKRLRRCPFRYPL